MSALDDIRQREQAATKGPLEVVTAPNPYFACVNDSRHENIMSTWNHTPVLGIKDAEFFAHASTDMSSLLRTLDAVLALADKWAALGPADDWAEGGMADTVLADAGRAVRAAVNDALEADK